MSVTYYRNRVCDSRNFIELVRDHDAGDVICLEFSHKVEKVCRVIFVESRCRLIKYEKLNILRKCLGDLNKLLLSDSEVLDKSVRVYHKPYSFKYLNRSPSLFIPVDKTFPCDLVTDKDIFGHRQLRYHCEFLMYYSDSCTLRLFDILELHLTAHKKDLAFI